MSLQIHLPDFDHLFVAPDQNAFDRRYNSQSGLAQLLTRCRTDGRLLDDCRAAFVFPKALQHDHRAAHLNEAISRYCDDVIRTTQAQLRADVRSNRINFAIGLALLGISLAMGYYLGQQTAWNPSLSTLLSNSVGILGSVALWIPTEQMLFGHDGLRKHIRLHQAAKSMRFEFLYQDETETGTADR